MKANFSAKFNVYSDNADAETLENSSSQCSEMLHLSFTGITGHNSLYADNADRRLSQTLKKATVQ